LGDLLDSENNMKEETGKENMQPLPTKSSVDIFISHSSRDMEMAEMLIALLRSATAIEPDRIRCTSVPGYRLPGGVSVDEQLRNEILSSRVFVAVITRESLKSTYVLFELGARWGAGAHSSADFKLIPLLAAGMNANELRAPLRGFSVHSCDKEDDLQQLVLEISSELRLTPRSYTFYKNELKELKEQSGKEEMRRRIPQTLAQPSKPVAAKPANFHSEDTIRRIREALTLNNRKRDWKRLEKIASFVRISEDEALKLLRSMPDVIVGTGKDGHQIARKKSYR
jgi:hypothetical protein